MAWQFLSNPGFWKGVGSVAGGLIGSGGIFGGGGAETYIDPKQQPYLDFTRNLGRSLTEIGAGGAASFGQQAGRNLYGFGEQALGQLGANPFLQSLQAQAQGNPQLVQRQIGDLQSALGRSFREDVLPGIRQDFASVGALGGGRMAPAYGQAAGRFGEALSRGITDIQAADALRAQQAAVSGGGLLSQGLLGGLSSLGGLFDVGLGQFTGGFAPLSLYSQILGPPTQLQKSSGGLF